jgi:hypothetical protein
MKLFKYTQFSVPSVMVPSYIQLFKSALSSISLQNKGIIRRQLCKQLQSERMQRTHI